jgi:hypothetical protein
MVGFFYDVYILEMPSTIYIHYPKCVTKNIWINKEGQKPSLVSTQQSTSRLQQARRKVEIFLC